MKSYHSRMLPVLLISFALLYNSCTLVGLGIGAIVDSSRPDPENKVVNLEDYENIKLNIKIIVHLKDNSSKVGRFYERTEQHLILRFREEIENIDLDKILYVEIDTRKNGKRNGFLIGLALDIAF